MAINTTTKQYGMLNFGMPFMEALTFPDASNLNTELERMSFLRLSPDVTPSQTGQSGAGPAVRPLRIYIGIGI
jgi:hypothetical protein